MNDAYRQLLDSTIHHLESLKARGSGFVPVQADTLVGLSLKASGPAQVAPAPARPASFPAPAPRPAMIPHPANAPTPAPSAPTVPQGSSAAAAILGTVPESLDDAMALLREKALACVRCPNLAAARQSVVFGVGDIRSPLMFVGEAPGADEDALGEPFVGKAGQLLTKIIEVMGLSRDKVYIANILKCRPDTPGESSGNRKPTLDEMKTCSPYLLAQIELIKPKVIVALGGTAVEGLLGNFTGITRLRGGWQTFRGIPVMPTYHPAFLLRNQALGEKRRVWEDMLKVLERLGLPITEKQRGFFLPKES